MAVQQVVRGTGQERKVSVEVTHCAFCNKPMDGRKYPNHIRKNCDVVEEMRMSWGVVR